MELPHTESVWRLRGGWWVTGKRVRFFLKIQVWLFSCHAKPRGAARKAEGFLTCLCCQGVCEGYFRLEVYVCDNCTTVKLVCFRTLRLCVCVCAHVFVKLCPGLHVQSHLFAALAAVFQCSGLSVHEGSGLLQPSAHSVHTAEPH